MNVKSMEQAKNALQTLTESLWIFSALSVSIESGILATLTEKTLFKILERTTKLPETVLKQTINLLVETEFLISKDEKVWLAPGMYELVKQFD